MRRSIIITILILSVVFQPFVLNVQAAEDQFHITQVVVGNPDVDPPSIPLGLTATAVSSSQINLSWLPSTDNIGVTGYRIYRDLVHIATSTVTSYSDSGLNPSTTYDYTVTAIDAVYNESGHSATSSATTFPVTTGPTGGTSGSNPGSIELLILYFLVEPDTTNATIKFGTNLDVQSTISWGLTADHELGTISSALYQKDHSIRLEELTPDTKYYFKVRLMDGYGRVRVIDNQEFRTLPLRNLLPPENVSNFQAVPDTNVINLSWENPNSNFDQVRIVRSDKFFPRDPLEGKVIYEGRAEEFVDTDVVHGTRYYYTAFTRDPLGNYSSGTMDDAILLKPGEEYIDRDLFADILLLPKELIHPVINELSLLDIDFIQDGKKLPIVSDTVEIKGDRALTISIDYHKVPEILKTIVVTLRDPLDNEKSFSFLLRVNEDKTAYNAVIGALERPGKYTFGITILDLKNQGLKKMAGVLVATVPQLAFEGGSNIFDTFRNNPFYGFLLILLLLLLLIIFLISRMLKRKTRSAPTFQSMKNSSMMTPPVISVMPTFDQNKK